MENTTTLIYYRYDFWIVAGILIYLAGSFFIYVYSNELDGPTRETFWMFTNIFTVIKHIAFFIAVLSFSKPINNKFSKINPYHN